MFLAPFFALFSLWLWTVWGRYATKAGLFALFTKDCFVFLADVGECVGDDHTLDPFFGHCSTLSVAEWGRRLSE